MNLPEDRSLATATLAAPIGVLRLAAVAGGLCAVLLPGETVIDLPRRRGDDRARAHLAAARAALVRYFARQPAGFDRLALAPGGTEFDRLVWSELAAIPWGETRSYGDVARAIGRPRAVRAVGGANGRNPLPIVVPCHRVIGADGSLTGFGGGLPLKRWLLAFECGAAADALSRARAALSS